MRKHLLATTAVLGASTIHASIARVCVRVVAGVTGIPAVVVPVNVDGRCAAGVGIATTLAVAACTRSTPSAITEGVI